MREISAEKITEVVRRLCIEANCHLPQDVKTAIEKAYTGEKWGQAREILERIMEKYQLSEARAKDMIVKKDKQRQSYYNYYSSKKWGRADSYDLCINSSVLGVDGTVKLIAQYVEDFEALKQ